MNKTDLLSHKSGEHYIGTYVCDLSNAWHNKIWMDSARFEYISFGENLVALSHLAWIPYRQSTFGLSRFNVSMPINCCFYFVCCYRVQNHFCFRLVKKALEIHLNLVLCRQTIEIKYIRIREKDSAKNVDEWTVARKCIVVIANWRFQFWQRNNNAAPLHCHL